MNLKKSNFTMVELLTVMAIIAILAGIAFPAIGRARVSAKASACLSNQRQTAILLKQVMNDNDQFLKLATAANNNWGSYLNHKKYINNQDIDTYRCTVVHNDNSLNQLYGLVTNQTGTTDTTVDGFDFRRTITDGTNEVSPSALALGGCAVASNGFANSIMDFTGNSNGRVFGQHGNEITNMFFLDGHAQAVKKDEMESFFYATYTVGEADNIEDDMFGIDGKEI